jgi:hypothetical protein
VTVDQTMSRSITKYWWTMRSRIRAALDHSTSGYADRNAGDTSLCCFTDVLDELAQRELEHAVTVEIGTHATGDEGQAFLARFDHVRDALFVTRLRHRPVRPLR